MIIKRVPSGRSFTNDDDGQTIERGCRAIIMPAITTTTGERSMIRCNSLLPLSRTARFQSGCLPGHSTLWISRYESSRLSKDAIIIVR
jgi:hypothetical protein